MRAGFRFGGIVGGKLGFGGFGEEKVLEKELSTLVRSCGDSRSCVPGWI